MKPVTKETHAELLERLHAALGDLMRLDQAAGEGDDAELMFAASAAICHVIDCCSLMATPERLGFLETAEDRASTEDMAALLTERGFPTPASSIHNWKRAGLVRPAYSPNVKRRQWSRQHDLPALLAVAIKAAAGSYLGLTREKLHIPSGK